MPKGKFYVTTAIDYVNDVIHIGHSYQKILADILYRCHRLNGQDARFLTGTDNHGRKAEEGAKRADLPVVEFSRKISDEDEEQLRVLNIHPSRFIRTTDPDHKKTVYRLYQEIKANGDIYRGEYKSLYCPGCEEFKTQRDLVAGKCSAHPTAHLEILAEENYFFRLSKYQDFLTGYIERDPKFVQPEGHRKEVLAFLRNEPLQDTPISRPKVKWGIPFPDDPDHTFYVWFEALINYVTGADDHWPADIHFIGKDNLRFHTILWPAMLKSAGIELPKTIYAHGFLSIGGQKISKSLGNVIRPKELVSEMAKDAGIDEKLAADGVRYYLARYGPLVKDADFSREHLKEIYNADLANGLGNLIARVAKLCEKSGAVFEGPSGLDLSDKVNQHLDNIRPDLALEYIWANISALDKYIDKERPWSLEGSDLKNRLRKIVVGEGGREGILQIAHDLKPFTPEISKRVAEHFKGPKIEARPPLFPRVK